MCRSWYSDISILTIASSSSNRNSASALASSVFPTPVGPRKIKDPIGLFGSCIPARALLTASETAFIASSCPTTRNLSRSSIFRSFLTSPSSILLTGIPVHFETISAISSSSTSSFSILLVLSCCISFAFSSSNSFCRARIFPYFNSAALFRSPSLSAFSASIFARSRSSLIELIFPMASFSLNH